MRLTVLLKLLKLIINLQQVKKRKQGKEMVSKYVEKQVQDSLMDQDLDSMKEKEKMMSLNKNEIKKEIVRLKEEKREKKEKDEINKMKRKKNQLKLVKKVILKRK